MATSGLTVHDEVALVQPDHARAHGLDRVQAVADQEDATCLLAELVHPQFAAVTKLGITGVERLIHQENLGIDARGDGKPEA